MLESLSFLSPMILIALVSLPALWFLLKVTPPPPKMVSLPTQRFLQDLPQREHSAQKTPWWLLMLRLLALSFIIIGFSGPVLNASSSANHTNSLKLMIDNSWAAAANWSAIVEKAEQILNKAEREDQMVKLTLLAKDQRSLPTPAKELTARDALSIVKGLTPQSWGIHSDHIVNAPNLNKDAYDIKILSSGLFQDELKEVTNTFSDKQSIELYLPEQTNAPYVLSFSNPHQNDVFSGFNNDFSDLSYDGFIIYLTAYYQSQTVRDLSILALGDGGKAIDRVAVNQSDWQESNGHYVAEIKFNLPPELSRKVKRLQLQQQKTAGATLIVDPARTKKSVGIVEIRGEKDRKAYIGDSFYIDRALRPYAEIMHGAFGDVLDEKPDVLILPDHVSASTEQLNVLKTWLEDGGILIRFAGPSLMEGTNSQLARASSLFQYLPVTLRRGGRSMGGNLSWEKAKTMKEFDVGSIFYGLAINEDIKVKDMALAQPDAELESKILARLEDGTPLITYEKRHKGVVILYHVSANANGSTLPLSGLYVSMLKRLLDLSHQPSSQLDLSASNINNAIKLRPLYVLNGFGDIDAPSNFVKPISLSVEQSLPQLSQHHPAGLYAHATQSLILNVGAAEFPAPKAVTDASDLLSSIKILNYGPAKEQHIGKYFLFTAMILLIIDLLVSQFLSRQSRPKRAKSRHIKSGKGARAT